MTVSAKSTKILWANAGGYCSFAGCPKKLFKAEDDGTAPYTLGEMAHICGEKVGANRHDTSQSPKQRDDYANLILLCPDHHTEIDKPENEGLYSVATLKFMKAAHEASVRGRLEHIKYADKRDLACYIGSLLAENYNIFTVYGPLSEIARKHPESDAHKIWLSERFSTIIPNNRRMSEVISSNLALFNVEEKAKISEFLLHVRSYERWVNDEITYEGVVRFPIEFHTVINEVADG